MKSGKLTWTLILYRAFHITLCDHHATITEKPETLRT